MLPRLPLISRGLLPLILSAVAVQLAAQAGSAPSAVQSVVTVQPQQCVWHTGDDSSWAATALDESGWRPYREWTPQPGQTSYWVRCHADLSPIQNIAHPAVQAGVYASYDLYLDGRFLGGAGNLRNGKFRVDYFRSYPVSGVLVPSGPSTIALRITRRSPVTNSGPILGLVALPLQINAGDPAMLDAVRARLALARASSYSETALCYGIIGVLSVVLLGLWFYDRDRRELLLLCISCLSLTTLRLNEFYTASLGNYSFASCIAIVDTGNIGLTFSALPFFYALARRRVPPVYWVLLAITSLGYLPSIVDILFVNHQPAWLSLQNSIAARPITLISHMALSLAPFTAFWPYARVSPRIRPLAALCMLWALADEVWFIVQFTSTHLFGLPDIFGPSSLKLLDIRAFMTAGVLAALLGLLFREQRQATEEHAMLAGEMQAARTVQQVIIPEAIPSAPGFAINSVYKPAGEVGGDFFQILPAAAGGVLMVIGDVSGKGMPAAMTVSLLVGTVRTLAHYIQSPAEILAAMNSRMLGRSQDGFTTCLVVRADPDGSLTVSNAGHLAPYLDGSELSVENGLPLGLHAGAAYSESAFRLTPGAQLTLLTDGVIESRNPAGELFGFDRTTALSAQPAEAMAQAAQRFGQQDDITVLTLTRLLPATEALSPGYPSSLPATS